MTLDYLLKERRSDILKAWFDSILATYHPDAARVMGSRKDPFANPVGSTFKRAVEQMYDAFVDNADKDCIEEPLAEIVKIRSIQNFTPSEALSFVFFLKRIVRDLVETEDGVDETSNEVEEFNSRVDDLALLAFEAYVKSREKIGEIKVRETRRAMGKLLERAGMEVDVPAGPPDRDENDMEVSEANT